MRIHTRVVVDIETGRVLTDESYQYSGPLALCDRSAQAQAAGAVKNANATASNFAGNAAQERGSLIPFLQSELQNPNGFTPSQTNSMLVAGEQGAGGANSAIAGEAGLRAMRTRNTGGTSGILDQAARRTAQNLSQNAVNVASENAKLGAANRQRAASGLTGLYGVDTGAQMKALGLVPEDINAEVNAGRSGWVQNLEGGINAIANAAKGYAAMRNS